MNGYFCSSVLDVKFVFGDLVGHLLINCGEEICVCGIPDICIIQGAEIMALEKILHSCKVHILHTCEKFLCSFYRFMTLVQVPGDSAGNCRNQKNDQADDERLFALFLSARGIVFEIVVDQ